MTTIALPIRKEKQFAAPPTRRILVATDGSTGSDSAVVAASRLAVHLEAIVEVLTVLEPLPVLTPEAQLPISMELSSDYADRRSEVIRAQLRLLTGTERSWPMRVEAGLPADGIAARARAIHADMIVVGLGRHGMIDRVIGNEVVLSLLRIAAVPVLAVAPGAFNSLPTRLIGAVDFSRESARAIRCVADMAADGASLELTHVVARDAAKASAERPQTPEQRAASQFGQFRSRLHLPNDLSVKTSTISGDPADSLLRLAEASNADLLAAGTHGYGFMSRLLLGSVTTKLVRGAKVFAFDRAAVWRVTAPYEGSQESSHSSER